MPGVMPACRAHPAHNQGAPPAAAAAAARAAACCGVPPSPRAALRGSAPADGLMARKRHGAVGGRHAQLPTQSAAQAQHATFGEPAKVAPCAFPRLQALDQPSRHPVPHSSAPYSTPAMIPRPAAALLAALAILTWPLARAGPLGLACEALTGVDYCTECSTPEGATKASCYLCHKSRASAWNSDSTVNRVRARVCGGQQLLPLPQTTAADLARGHVSVAGDSLPSPTVVRGNRSRRTSIGVVHACVTAAAPPPRRARCSAQPRPCRRCMLPCLPRSARQRRLARCAPPPQATPTALAATACIAWSANLAISSMPTSR